MSTSQYKANVMLNIGSRIPQHAILLIYHIDLAHICLFASLNAPEHPLSIRTPTRFS